jgi:hypothetical protein
MLHPHNWENYRETNECNERHYCDKLDAIVVKFKIEFLRVQYVPDQRAFASKEPGVGHKS